MKTGSSNDISIVGIHASILSIIIAFLSMYGLFVFGKLDDLEHQAFSEALKINNVHLMYTYKSPRHQFIHLLNVEPKLRYLTVLDSIKNIFLSDFNENYKNGMNPTSDFGEKGTNLLCNMTVLENIYPFATYIYFDENGKVLDKETKEPVIFDSLNDIRMWIEDIDKIVLNIHFLYIAKQSKLTELFQEAEKAWHAKYPVKEDELLSSGQYSSADIEDLMRGKLIINNFRNDFFENIAETQNILLRTRKILEDYDLYKNKHISKKAFSCWLLFACISFISSVIIPLLFNKTKRIFIIYIPLSFYSTIIIFIILKILII